MQVAVWAFDVDGCLVDSLTGSSLRPGARQVLHDLHHTSGVSLVLWSAGGAEYAERAAIRFGVDALVDTFAAKASRGDDGRYVADHLTVDLASVVFVDDRPEDLPEGADVIAVSPYVGPNTHDRGLVPVAQRVAELNATAAVAPAAGHSPGAGSPPRSRTGSGADRPRPQPG